MRNECIACTHELRTIICNCSDLVWEVVNSSAWCYGLIIFSVTVVSYMPLFFFIQYGPGDRSHSAELGRNGFILLYVLHLFNSVVFNLLARSRIRVQAQKVLLGRLQLSEISLVSLVMVVILCVRVTGGSNPNNHSLCGMCHSLAWEHTRSAIAATAPTQETRKIMWMTGQTTWR